MKTFAIYRMYRRMVWNKLFKQCVGHCRYGAACNHVTGQCDSGCEAAWTGYLCDKGIVLNYIATCYH